MKLSLTLSLLLILFAGGVFGYSPTYAEIQEMYDSEDEKKQIQAELIIGAATDGIVWNNNLNLNAIVCIPENIYLDTETLWKFVKSDYKDYWEKVDKIAPEGMELKFSWVLSGSLQTRYPCDEEDRIRKEKIKEEFSKEYLEKEN